MSRDEGALQKALDIGRVLVVEDEPLAGKVICRILEQNGFAVHHAENRRDALACLDRYSDLFLVILDVVLEPGPNGSESGKELAIEIVGRDNGILIKFITAYTEQVDVAELRAVAKLYFDGYYEKPITPAALLDNVRHAREQYRRRVEQGAGHPSHG